MKKSAKIIRLAFLGLAVGVMRAQATNTVSTAVFDDLETHALAYVAYGVAAFVAILGAGMAIVGGRWVYARIKSGMRSA